MVTELRINRELILDNSPVEFVLIGPYRRSRSVFAKSTGATLDLIGLDSDNCIESDNGIGNSSYLERVESRLIGARNLNIFGPIQKRAYIVRATAKTTISTDVGSDVRHSEVAFCWRGLATVAQRKEIEALFESLASSAFEAARRVKTGEFQWTLAPLILTCDRFTKVSERRVSSRRGFVLLAIMTYILAAAVALTGFLASRGEIGRASCRERVS
jgi:hypothetical protein